MPKLTRDASGAVVIRTAELFGDTKYADLYLRSGESGWWLHRVIVLPRWPKLEQLHDELEASDDELEEADDELEESDAELNISDEQDGTPTIYLNWDRENNCAGPDPLPFSFSDQPVLQYDNIVSTALEFIYSGDYCSPKYGEVQSPKDTIMFEMRVFDFAHTWEIWELKEESQKRLLAAVAAPISVTDFTEIAQHLFQTHKGPIAQVLQDFLVQIGPQQAHALYTSPATQRFRDLAETTRFGSCLAHRLSLLSVHDLTPEPSEICASDASGDGMAQE